MVGVEPVVVKRSILKSKTLWLNVAAVITAACALLPQWVDKLPISPTWRSILLFVAVVLQSSGVLAARKAGVDLASDVGEAAPGVIVKKE